MPIFLKAASKSLKQILLFVSVSLLAYCTYSGFINIKAALIKPAMQQEIDEWVRSAKSDDKKPLGTVAGIQWDLICVPSHYADGVKVVNYHSHSTGTPISLFNFSVADERMGDAQYGLTFISFDKKLLVTIPLNLYVEFGRSVRGCEAGDTAYLSEMRPAALSNDKGFVSFIRIPNRH